jgi:hypothetical protein
VRALRVLGIVHDYFTEWFSKSRIIAVTSLMVPYHQFLYPRPVPAKEWLVTGEVAMFPSVPLDVDAIYTSVSCSRWEVEEGQMVSLRVLGVSVVKLRRPGVDIRNSACRKLY